MSTFLPLIKPQQFFHPNTTSFQTLTHKVPIFKRTHFPNPKTHFRAPPIVAKFGVFNSGQIPDPETIKELFGRAEGLLYTIADASVSNTVTDKQDGDWLSGITNSMETVLKVLKGGLSTLHVPYAYGFAIILLTVLVKAATFPLSKKQVESTMAMRTLQPQIKAIQKQYAGDQEKIQLETARLYKVAGINPFAGCLPTLATIPVWIGLYRALSNVANEGLLTEGFFWIPSLAGPTTTIARQNGSAISWLFPFVDGHPPLGWSDTSAYLVLPVLLVLAQYISIQIMQSSQPNDPSVKTSQALTSFLPLMIGYFALSVPSGLGLYWFTNNILSTAQQVLLQKMGGSKISLGKLNDDILKQEQSQPQTNVSEIEPIQIEAKSSQIEEVSPSTGLRAGERFQQLKREELRRKQLTEEAKIQAGEIETKFASVTEDLYEKQDDAVGSVSRNEDDLVDKVIETDRSASNASNGLAANGNASKEHDIMSVLTNENGRLLDETMEQLVEDPRKEVV